MEQIKNVRYIKSCMDWRDAPQPALPEIAFVGRSNVGKSSLINTLTNIKNLAKVSKQPGKTRSINYFLVDDKFYLVDLPGYGFAKISQSEQKKWQEAIEGFLLNSPSLLMLYVLIDSKVGAKSNDVQLVEWLRYNKVPFSVIATKADRISRTEQQRQEKAIRQALAMAESERLLLFSSKSRLGRGALTGEIMAMVGRAK
jgi:GTP-binding protein